MKHIKLFEEHQLQEGTPTYKEQVLAFMDHPWQEDKEIEFVGLLNQNRASIEKGTDAITKDYLKRMNDANLSSGSVMQFLSDKFMSDLDALIESKVVETLSHIPEGDEQMVKKYIEEKIKDGYKTVPEIASDFNADHDSGVGHGEFKRIVDKYKIEGLK